MELDELKVAWQRMDADLRTQRRVTSTLVAERTASRLQSSLKPLLNWQVVQIVAGVLVAMLGGSVWTTNLDAMPLLVSGSIVHLYGIALIVNGARVVLRLRQIDYGAPVVRLQSDVTRLERSYITSGWILALPWWLLWIPFTLVVMAAAGVDVAQSIAGSWILANVVFGVAGMAATVAVFVWARRSNRPGLRERLGRMASAVSIDRAKRALAEIERFEREG